MKSLVDQIIENAVDEVKEEERPKDVKFSKVIYLMTKAEDNV